MADKYTVKSGDSLSKIAKANGTTVSKLIAANPMLTNNPKYNGGSTIFSGTVLTLPSAAGAATGLSTAVNSATGAGGANTDSQNAAKYTSTNTGTSTSTANATGVTTATQAATNIDKLDMATLQAKFGIAAGIIGADTSLKAVLDRILSEGITSEALMTQLIQESLWYKNQTDKQRAFVYAKETNPGQFAADLQLNASNIVKQFMGNGIKITAAQAIEYAQQLMQSVIVSEGGKVIRYDQDFLNKIMANSIDFSTKSIIGGKQIYNLTGKLETVANELYKRAYDYGFDSSMSNERFAGWFENSMRGLISGTTNAEDIDNELQKQAMSMFPGLTNQLSQGLTLRAAADPWLTAIANTWEVDPNSLELNNDFVQRALNYTDEKGGVSTMNLYETKKMARRSGNFDYTSTAKEEKTGIANTILRDFGFLG
jgi:murein DD-endopeptidase MepM/ murein hydrolase activator NlpD